ncbi:hypothetical protein KR009_009602 [Drosophila setifemur]|nr:hypothetical protein KR009_009602 [Drosophila setifemur]
MEHDLYNVKDPDPLPDCAKLPLDRIDIIERTLKCETLEIFDTDEVTFSVVEEEELELTSLSPDSETDDKERGLMVVHEIDCMVKRIELMQLAIRKRQKAEQAKIASEDKAEEEEEQPLVFLTKMQRKCQKLEEQRKDMETTLNSRECRSRTGQLSCEEIVEVRDLLQSHHRLQCAIDEVICRYRKLREVLLKMQGNICNLEHQLREVNAKSQEYLAWADQVSKELHVCKERYQHLLKVKISKKEAQTTDKVHAVRCARRNSHYLSRLRMKRELMEFSEEVNDLVSFMDELHKKLDQNLVHLFPNRKLVEWDNSSQLIVSFEIAAILHEMIDNSTKINAQRLAESN